MYRILTVVVLLLGTSLLANAQTQTRGITGRPAPDLAVDSWVSPATAPTPPTISALEGDVVVLFFFQSWCPGCHSAGFPTVQALIQRYRGQDRVHFQIVQTVFEGHASNTPERAADTAKEYGLSVPVGHAGTAGVHPAIMRCCQQSAAARISSASRLTIHS
jgi:thiol-disulfide isomerase/thioredoxin